MKSSFARLNHVCFNFGVESLVQSVKLDRLVIFISALTIPLSKHHFFQIDNQKAMLFTVFSLLELFLRLLYCCCGVERRPTSNASHCFARKFSEKPNVKTSKARI